MAIRQQQVATKVFEADFDFPEMPALFTDARQDELHKWWERVRVTLRERDDEIVARIKKLEGQGG